MSKIALPPEKIGSFYLGAEYDLKEGQLINNTINYDARDLTTHAICVGMTGSGKTGLCIGLLEEAAMDKVPAIIIDPKGDMTNLMLQFDELKDEQFRPWINEDDARRKDMTIEEYTKSTAEKWKNGLAAWGQGTDRIKALNKTVDYTIFTPGSNSGIPINILGSFAAPKDDFDENHESNIERIQGIVAALLGMINSKEDPSRSKEGILLSNIFEEYWRKGENLDLTKLILSIQKPPFDKLGVFDLESFYPEKERFQLMMSFNALVASPSFKYWLEGEPLDIDKLYFTESGKPRHSIIYIAHLSDSERMFFVTLLLNSLITWMRRQSGTTSLRSLLYFDEIFGYFPPTANPPSKKPLLTILKQARAFGLGAVLVTQNPVDIDYKGISNAGTWFIGKLQTERDKMRVLDGLKGAIAEAGSESEMDFDNMISSLDSRVFLLHNVHGDDPVVFHTRWVMSYLRGPLTRPQIKEIMSSKKEMSESSSSKFVKEVSNKPSSISSTPPAIDTSIVQKFFSIWKSGNEASEAFGDGSPKHIEYRAKVLAEAKVRFYNAKRGIDHIQQINLLASNPDEFGRIDWGNAIEINKENLDIGSKADQIDNTNLNFATVSESMNTSKEFKKIESEFENWVYQNKKHISYEHPSLKLYMNADESNEAFLARVQLLAREKRDEELDELKAKYETKFDRLDDKIRKEEQDVEEAEADLRDRRTSEVIDVAEKLFSVFVKGRSRSFSSNATKRRMSRKAKMKLEDSQEDLENLHGQYDDLEKELKEKIDVLTAEWDQVGNGIQSIEIAPRKTDIIVDSISLAWEPYWISESGKSISARK